MKKESQIKKRKTYELRLTKFELLHVRDLLSVALPPDVKKTLSQALAELENRILVETSLWNKVSDLCEVAGLPTGDDAPDYVVAPSSAPPLDVFQLASEPPDEGDDDGDEEEGGKLNFIKSGKGKGKDEEE